MTKTLSLALALTPLSLSLALLAGGTARADELDDALLPDALVRIDNCPADLSGHHPRAMRCLSSRLVPRAYAEARKIGPFTPPPDAGIGVDAGIDISTCNGNAGGGGGSANPSGLGPPQYAKAYNIPAAAMASGKIVAIVDACAETTVVADLAAYRSKFGLPALPECGGADGHAPTPGGTPCFGVVSQRGDGALPPADDGWAGEIALDVDMASAGCPECSILLVEADTPNSWDLGPAVNEAVTLGASAVSNSYGAVEDPNDPYGTAYSDGPYTSYYQHDGVLIAVASGDGSYNNQGQPSVFNTTGPSFPSTIPEVLSVGGTELKTSATAARGYTEIIWPGSTSGCSAEFDKPAYQSGLATGSCAKRADVDVAAPGSGVSTYMGGGWANGVGGTSCASPFVAALFTHIGLAGASNAFLYANPSAFFDLVTSDAGTGGNNDPGKTCTDVMCNLGPGWDGPSGLGSPNAALLVLLDAGPGGAVTDAGLDATLANDSGGGGGGDGEAPGSSDGSPGGSSEDGAAVAPGSGNGGAGSSKGCGCVTAGSAGSGGGPGAVLLAAIGAIFLGRRRRRG